MRKDNDNIVYINLTTGEIDCEPCPDELLKKYLGGRGLSDYLLLKYLDQNTGPLDPENILIIACGLLTGTEMVTSGRLHFSSRSPLTGFIGTSNGGGKLASELRACNIITLIITGKAVKPVFINITGEDISIQNASDLWGLSTTEAEKQLKLRLNDSRTQVALIGPAGENQTNIGSIMTGDGHFAGRTGMGSVMGSKNLKAIAVRKTSNQRNHQTPETRSLIRQYIKSLKSQPDWNVWTTVGSSCDVSWTQEKGALATRNYQDISFEGTNTACGVSFKENVVKHKACYNCPIHCKADVQIDRGRHKGFVGDRPEYETLSAWGPRCGNADSMESIYFCNLCNDYGVDSISAGNLVAFAMALYQKGILTLEDTGELPLTWGNVNAMEALIRQISTKSTPLGKILSLGMKGAAEAIGNSAQKYAYHVKGMSLTIMDPRGFKGSALGYAVGNRGADFTYIYAKPEFSYTPEKAFKAFGTMKAADRLSEEGKPAMVKSCMCANAVIDSLGVCKIPEFGILGDFDLTIIAEIVSAITESSVTGEQLLKIGERIVNTERLFNFKYGATSKDDNLPEKFLTEPIQQGPCKGSVVHLNQMLNEFYFLMGWDEKGRISKAKLRELEIDYECARPSESADLKVLGLDNHFGQ
ncbi:MAG: aldehyde ferredoxin oxidoreductase family protein [Desulfotignum sp.]|nr:aldehyde ferredoxin oxidoreductase family protein [Desulfotignum sp.]MCF8088612.1 aldehyde ferredoxin oxidoreductase family protein [Desulfotignum sp.]MCF8137970.1 aldehyde ferredoxin oxidoreductase family protein [Desulfotignum sp.]